jgi:uncharacterized protein YkwD
LQTELLDLGCLGRGRDAAEQGQGYGQDRQIQNNEKTRDKYAHDEVLSWILKSNVAESKQNLGASLQLTLYRRRMNKRRVLALALLFLSLLGTPYAVSQSGSRSESPSAASIPFDADTETELLDLANQARAKAGVLPLKMDYGLTKAARTHSMKMAREHALSHQLPGEAPFLDRLNRTSDVHFQSAGENVALDISAAGAQRHLMQSPPHRENLLNPAYNLVGIGVVHAGPQLYVTEDFAQGSKAYSAKEAEAMVTSEIERERSDVALPGLTKEDHPGLRDIACSLAKENRTSNASTHELAQQYHVVMYMNTSIEKLPKDASEVVRHSNLRNFSVGVCYAQNASVPMGAYWVLLLFD